MSLKYYMNKIIYWILILGLFAFCLQTINYSNDYINTSYTLYNANSILDNDYRVNGNMLTKSTFSILCHDYPKANQVIATMGRQGNGTVKLSIDIYCTKQHIFNDVKIITQ